jgi:hypothetical protein
VSLLILVFSKTWYKKLSKLVDRLGQNDFDINTLLDDEFFLFYVYMDLMADHFGFEMPELDINETSMNSVKKNIVRSKTQTFLFF